MLQEEFDLTMNFDFFGPNNLGFLHGMNVKFGLWTFHKLRNGRKILSLLTFVALMISITSHYSPTGENSVFLYCI